MGKVQVDKLTLRYVGVFDFDGLYATAVDWAKTNGYLWHEKAHKHKKKGKGAEQELEWVMIKKVSEYIKFTVDIEVHLWDLHEVEVEINGEKKPLSSAKIQVVLNGEVEYDWQSWGSKSGQKLSKKFTGWLSMIYPKITEEHWVYTDQLYYRMLNLQGQMKKFFDMQGKKNVYKQKLEED